MSWIIWGSSHSDRGDQGIDRMVRRIQHLEGSIAAEKALCKKMADALELIRNGHFDGKPVAGTWVETNLISPLLDEYEERHNDGKLP